MVTRIVKMTFKPESVESFKQIFSESKKLISNFEGCLHLELLIDINDKNTFFTLSKWNSEADLEHYRESYIFKNTWSKVKPLFGAKAEAWSLSSAE